MKKIRVLVVDDSEFQCGLITGILETDPDIEVIGHAVDGADAVDKTLKLKPDVITMDMYMPVMDGVTAIKEIMAEMPTPILVISATIKDDQKFAFTCLKHGALDFLPMSSDSGIAPEELISKVKICSKVKVVSHFLGKRRVKEGIQPSKKKIFEIAGIAVSTGGPLALMQVLCGLSGDFTVPILVVQHISEGFTQSLAEWLNEQCKLKVLEAKDGEKLKAGIAYLAPNNYHLIVDEERKLKLIAEDFPRCYHKPAADVMFKSMASVYGEKAIAVIMTGMGKDGAAGIKAIKDAGGFTIAQDEASSVIYGMNKAAIDNGSIIEVLPLGQISRRLIELAG